MCECIYFVFARVWWVWLANMWLVWLVFVTGESEEDRSRAEPFLLVRSGRACENRRVFAQMKVGKDWFSVPIILNQNWVFYQSKG